MNNNKKIKRKYFKEKKKIEIDLGKIIKSFFSKSFFIPLVIFLLLYKGCQLYKYLTYSVNAEKAILAINDSRRICRTDINNHNKFSRYQELAQTQIKKFNSLRSPLLSRILFDKSFINQDEYFFKNLSEQGTQNCEELQKTSFVSSQNYLESIQEGMVRHIRFL